MAWLIVALQELHYIFSLRISESVLPQQKQYSFVEILVREFPKNRQELMASLRDPVLLLMGDCSRNQWLNDRISDLQVEATFEDLGDILDIDCPLFQNGKPNQGCQGSDIMRMINLIQVSIHMLNFTE